MVHPHCAISSRIAFMINVNRSTPEEVRSLDAKVRPGQCFQGNKAMPKMQSGAWALRINDVMVVSHAQAVINITAG